MTRRIFSAQNKRMSLIVRCPYCGGNSVFSSENRFRPFCSERCKMIDLGLWADEAFKIPVADQTPQEEDFEEASELNDEDSNSEDNQHN